MPTLPKLAFLLLLAAAPLARAAEHVTLRNGSEFDCLRREPHEDKVRLILSPENYIDVQASQILSVEQRPDAALGAPSFELHPKGGVLSSTSPESSAQTSTQTSTLTTLLSASGTLHHIDSELLAAVVHAESNGHADAVSRAGARGLMQLMPATAAALGVKDSFAPAQNVEGGTAYLDALLTRYHDNVAFALAAYNAGPGAVDRFHGVPPFRETRAYVSRIIREFNQRKTALLLASNKLASNKLASNKLASNKPATKIK